MYNYPHYKEPEHNNIIAFMREQPFVTLIGTDLSGRIEITQVPVLVDEEDGKIILRGHIARKSDHQKAFEENPEVLALFTSPHVYVSGSWYTGTTPTGSTWNYISVHARGKVRFGTEDELIGFMKRLSLHFEKGDTNSITFYDNLPDEYTQRMIKGIVLFEMEVTELQNVFKLSQNRDEKSYHNIISKLEEQGGDGLYIAARMRENAPKLFRQE